MFSMTARRVTPAQLRNSSAPSSRRTAHSAKIVGAAAIALLAAGNTFANAAENPARLPHTQHACAIVLGLDPSERRYDACIRSLERSSSEWNDARLVSTDRNACARDALQPGTRAFAI
jgi:hypothetical protein